MIYLKIENHEREKQLKAQLNEISEVYPGSESSNLLCQFNYIISQKNVKDYYIQFNQELGTLSVAKEITGKQVLEYRKFVDIIIEFVSSRWTQIPSKYFTQSQNNSTMKKLTVANLNLLTDNDAVFVFKNKDYQNNALMLLTSNYDHRSGNMEYGFMNLENPLLSERIYRGRYMNESLEAAIQDGNEVYSAESISRIQLGGSEHVQKPVDLKPKLEKAASAIEKYIEGLLDGQIDFLLSELAITQFPQETIRKTAKRFFTEKMK